MNTPPFMRRLLGPIPGRGALKPGAADPGTHKTVAACEALLSQRGEASGAARAREALEAYAALEGPALAEFFDVLAERFSPDPDEVELAAKAYRQESSPANLIRLQHAVESPRQELFRRLNMAPEGTAALVEMRRRVLTGMKTKPDWAGIESDLEHLLVSWFNRGFLMLQRIDWRSSALVLEKLIRYEAVHAIKGWRDLRRRLEADRRCFAFFHPALPDEPIIFIEVALTRGLSDRVQPLIDADSPVEDPARADCAVFYSITNCQEGLRGISFGNFLIKQVAEDLGSEFPRLKTFATLSPVPGFASWLARAGNELALAPGGGAILAQLKMLDQPLWWERQESASTLRKLLMRLCAWYLIHVKRGDEPLDAVARFHLGNGADLERLNWMADSSESGLARAAGMMANYSYRIEDIERNHEQYANRHEVAASARLRALARECPLASKESSKP